MCEGLQEKVLASCRRGGTSHEPAEGQSCRWQWWEGNETVKGGRDAQRQGGERVGAEEPVRKANRVVGVFGLQGCLLFMEENRKVKLF